MFFSNVVVVGLLAVLSNAAPSSHIQHEKRTTAYDSQWIKRAEAPRGIKMPVRIAIAQRNIEQGHDLLMDVADPASPNYAKHWTAQQVAELFAPKQESIDAISAWLSSAGIGTNRHSVSPGRAWIKFDATVEEVESLVKAKYNVHTNKNTGEDHIFCDEYHVPHTVHSHIDFITPTVSMHNPLKKRTKLSKRGSGSVGALPHHSKPAPEASKGLTSGADICYEGLTPACIKQAYGIPDGTLAADSNQMGIFEDGDYYDQADLDLFWSKETTNIPAGTGPTLHAIDGAIAPETQAVEKAQLNGAESLLDFQIAIPLIYPQKTILFQVDDAYSVAYSDGFGNTFLDALDASYCTSGGGDVKGVDPTYPDTTPGGYNHTEMCGRYKPTHVISISYGLSEASFTRPYEIRQCHEYMKLGLQGVSVFFGSGDSGAACLGDGTSFSPDYPASCPYVTSVGATQIQTGAAITDLEVAVSDPADNYYSGGGFSNYFARPSYQNSAVNTYLTSHKPAYASGVYNASGRGIPDVAAVGLKIINYDGGARILQGGTSAATPIFAGIINMINEQRIAAGKRPVGFVNPTLYANPSAFTDIVNGTNPGCDTEGFSAVKGWDPVTGLGTPKYASLLKVFMALP